MLGVDACDLGAQPLWVDTGSEQLVIPLASPDAVRRTAPRSELILRHANIPLPGGGVRAMAYVWAANGEGRVLARFFFSKQGTIAEDPGTGSACANLGGWLIATGAERPCSFQVEQGEQVGRPCRLGLVVDAKGSIFVSGRVIELGRGTIDL
jgi:PhzF family phenazine biosynthesis protein